MNRAHPAQNAYAMATALLLVLKDPLEFRQQLCAREGRSEEVLNNL